MHTWLTASILKSFTSSFFSDSPFSPPIPTDNYPVISFDLFTPTMNLSYYSDFSFVFLFKSINYVAQNKMTIIS